MTNSGVLLGPVIKAWSGIDWAGLVQAICRWPSLLPDLRARRVRRLCPAWRARCPRPTGRRDSARWAGLASVPAGRQQVGGKSAHPRVRPSRCTGPVRGENGLVPAADPAGRPGQADERRVVVGAEGELVEPLAVHGSGCRRRGEDPRRLLDGVLCRARRSTLWRRDPERSS